LENLKVYEDYSKNDDFEKKLSKYDDIHEMGDVIFI